MYVYTYFFSLSLSLSLSLKVPQYNMHVYLEQLTTGSTILLLDICMHLYTTVS